jgi:hypothetical protein
MVVAEGHRRKPFAALADILRFEYGSIPLGLPEWAPGVAPSLPLAFGSCNEKREILPTPYTQRLLLRKKGCHLSGRNHLIAQ